MGANEVFATRCRDCGWYTCKLLFLDSITPCYELRLDFHLTVLRHKKSEVGFLRDICRFFIFYHLELCYE